MITRKRGNTAYFLLSLVSLGHKRQEMCEQRSGCMLCSCLKHKKETKIVMGTYFISNDDHSENTLAFLDIALSQTTLCVQTLSSVEKTLI